MDDAIYHLEEVLNATKGQQNINIVTGRISELKDAQLLIVYVRLYDKLDTKERKALFNEQTKWLADREKHVDEAVESRGGTAEASERNRAFSEFTEKRIRELEKRISKVTGIP